MGVETRIGRGVPDLTNRGYQVLFRPNESNRCPGCGHGQWVVGRVTAECFFCGTALPLADAKWSGSEGLTHRFEPIPTLVETTDWSERRRQERKPGKGRRIRLLVDGVQQAFRVQNISSGGAMIEGLEKLVSATSVELIAPGGEIVPVEIRWTGDGVAGLQFAKPVPVDSLAKQPKG